MAVFAKAERPLHQLEGRTLRWLAGPETGSAATSLLENVIEPGAAIPPHRHEVEELLHCLEGSGQVEVDGRLENFTAGDTAVIRAGALHSVRNVGSTPFRMLAFFPAPQPVAFWQDRPASTLT